MRASPPPCERPANGPLILGIDVGTSGLRACVVAYSNQASRPQICAEAAVSMPFPERQGAHSEQDCALWDEALEQLFTALAAQPQWREVAPAISHIVADATSSSVVLCRQDSGAPLGRAFMYDDQRAVHQAKAIAEAFEHARQQTPDTPECGAQGAGSTLAKVLYMLEALAGNAALPQNTPLQICHQIDWLNRRLTGIWCATDENNALKLGYDPQTRTWPAWVKSLLNDAAKRSRLRIELPAVVVPGTPLAPLAPDLAARWQLNPQLQVCAGTTDSIAGFLASGASACGDAVTSLGSTLAFKLLSKTPIFAPQYGVYSHRLGDQWLVGGASNSGGAVLLHYFTLEALQQTLTALEDDLDRTDALQSLTPTDRFYPLLRPGERFPIADPAWPPKLPAVPDEHATIEARKAFLLALLHGLCHIERMGYARLQALGADPLKRLYSVGGGTQNGVWQRMRTMYLQVPFTVAESLDAAYGVTRLVHRFSFNQNLSQNFNQNKESTVTVWSTQALIAALNDGVVEFSQTIATIDNEYDFTPTRFVNGETVNEAGSNNGSCKIFAFAKLHGLSERATLNAFGDYYRVDVLQHPANEDHQNIRNFMRYGWQGVHFEGEALQRK